MLDLTKYEGHSPGPWSACHDGECRCKQVWATDHPVATVESGIWGDSFPTLKMTGGSFDRKVEAVIEQIEYGEIYEAETAANARLIADAPLLLAEVERLKEENADLREKLEKATSIVRQLKAVSYDLNTTPPIVAMRTILESDGVVEFLAKLKEE